MAYKNVQIAIHLLKGRTDWFGDALDVIPKNFAVTLSTPLAQSLETESSEPQHYSRKCNAAQTLPPLPRPDMVQCDCYTDGCNRQRFAKSPAQ